MPLKRALKPMPDSIRGALTSRGLWQAYEARPPYQRNDYIAWITRAVRPETKQKRLETMLRELESGTGYMGMPYDATKLSAHHERVADKRE